LPFFTIASPCPTSPLCSPLHSHPLISGFRPALELLPYVLTSLLSPILSDSLTLENQASPSQQQLFCLLSADFPPPFSFWASHYSSSVLTWLDACCSGHDLRGFCPFVSPSATLIPDRSHGFPLLLSFRLFEFGSLSLRFPTPYTCTLTAKHLISLLVSPCPRCFLFSVATYPPHLRGNFFDFFLPLTCSF